MKRYPEMLQITTSIYLWKNSIDNIRPQTYWAKKGLNLEPKSILYTTIPCADHWAVWHVLPLCDKKYLVEGTVSLGHVRNSPISIFVAFLNRSRQADVVCITRKVGTWYGSFLQHVEIGQKFKKVRSFYGCNIQVSVHLSL